MYKLTEYEKFGYFIIFYALEICNIPIFRFDEETYFINLN